MKGKSVKVAAIVLVVTGLLGIECSNDNPKQATTTTKPTTTTTKPASKAGFVEFKDTKVGWAISYPEHWLLLQAKDAEVSLVASELLPAENKGGSLLARVVNLGTRIGEEELAEARKITDPIVIGVEGVQLRAEPLVLHQGGLPGYFYFYTFKDATSGKQGAHSHYFLFKGQTMITLVFQAVPDSEFARLATLFDEIIGTFRVLAPSEATATSTTTAPPGR